MDCFQWSRLLNFLLGLYFILDDALSFTWDDHSRFIYTNLVNIFRSWKSLIQNHDTWWILAICIQVFFRSNKRCLWIQNRLSFIDHENAWLFRIESMFDLLRWQNLIVSSWILYLIMQECGTIWVDSAQELWFLLLNFHLEVILLLNIRKVIIFFSCDYNFLFAFVESWYAGSTFDYFDWRFRFVFQKCW
jgi:hypothetical protein